jgi:hypothetical protein
MMELHHASTLSAGSLRHDNLCTSFRHLYPDVLTIPYAAHSLRFPGRTISNFQFLDHVQQVPAKRYAVRCMDTYSLSTVICPSFAFALTAASMSHMTSVT